LLEETPATGLPQLKLDDLLKEVQGRLAAVIGTRDRLHSLLEAVLAVAESLDLQGVLRRITEAAADLADASYAALGVISDDGNELAQFLVVGVDEDMVAKIGALPSGHGVLGELIRNPRPLRLHDLADHEVSFGFPANHPPMHSFLGVPIRVRDAVFGNLYLTQKRDGGDFDEEDEIVVQALAAAAGVAIQNARLYDESQLRQRLVEASNEISTALLSGTDPEDVLSLIAQRARGVTNARLAFAVLPMGDGRLLVEAADGDGADQLRGRLMSASETALGRVFETGEVEQFQEDALSEGAAAVAVPLTGPNKTVKGVLAVTGIPAVNKEVAVRTVSNLAAQASVALELAERRREMERYAVFEDRDRIARDLHDLVIQRLFATGMQLEGATRLIPERPDEASRRVLGAVDDLDATIRELRSTIYSLQAPAGEAVSLRARILQVVDAGTEQLGYAPSLRMEGLLDTLVPQPVADQVLAALREALSNAARHAAAQSVEVLVLVRDDRLTLGVSDDGKGLGATTRRSGLANLEARATALGGELVVESEPGKGTSLRWSVPLFDRAPQD
jgi:signal transduction histidine kinase